MKTLYITDLDGTFLNNDGVVSDESRRIVNALCDKGLLFSVATARSIMTVKELLNGLRISAPIVLMNGVFLYDLVKDRAVAYHEIENDAFEYVLAAFQAQNKAPMLFLYGDDGQFSIHFTRLDLQVNRDFYNARRGMLGERFRQVETLAIPNRQHAVYINLVDTFESLQPIAEALQKIEGVAFSFYGDTYTPYWFLEVYSANASKANAAREVKTITGAEHMVAFGDNFNDISLFSAADEKYAVQNAVNELKAQATGIIESNENDGVAKFLLQNY